MDLKIKNYQLGIDSHKVKTCESRGLLLEWKNLLSIQLAEVKNQLELYTKNHQEGKPPEKGRNYEWFIKTKKYLRLQNVLFGQINARLSFLKEKSRFSVNFWRGKCEELATPEQFEKFKREIIELIDKSKLETI